MVSGCRIAKYGGSQIDEARLAFEFYNQTVNGSYFTLKHTP